MGCQFCASAPSSASFDEVGYLFEYGSYVIVLDENSSRKVQRHRGEVQHAFDTGIDDRNNQVGGDCSGAGEDDDLDVELLDLMLEVSHVEAGDIVYDLADLLFVDIECGDDLQF